MDVAVGHEHIELLQSQIHPVGSRKEESALNFRAFDPGCAGPILKNNGYVSRNNKLVSDSVLVYADFRIGI